MPSWALSFGNDTDVYYLTLAWVALSAWCLWAFTGTPMGRLALAMRDNEHRVRFLGFNTHVARTLIFAISAMFTGVAGALLAIANEASQLHDLQCPGLGQRRAADVHRRRRHVLRAGARRRGHDLLRAGHLGPHPVVAALSGPHLRARHAVRARRYRRPESRCMRADLARRWIKHLVAPYLLCLAVGLLLIAGVVFTVESVHVRAVGRLLSRNGVLPAATWCPTSCSDGTFDPLSPLTWAIPVVLLMRSAARSCRSRSAATRICAWSAGRSHRAAAAERHEPPPASRSSSCAILHKSFGETPIIRGVDARREARSAPRR